MILTDKNAKDITRPRKIIFGEEWFVSPENFDNDFFGVVINGARPQPFPTFNAAQVFANAEVVRRKEEHHQDATISVIDHRENVLVTVDTNML